MRRSALGQPLGRDEERRKRNDSCPRFIAAKSSILSATSGASINSCKNKPRIRPGQQRRNSLGRSGRRKRLSDQKGQHFRRIEIGDCPSGFSDRILSSSVYLFTHPEETMSAFNAGKPSHGSALVRHGRLRGATDTDY